MKVTPITAGSGEPGQMVGNIQIGQSTTQEKKSNAVKAFRGEVPVSLTEKEPREESHLKKRRMVMKTNATPERFELNQEVPHGTTQEHQETQPATIEPNEEQAADATKPLSPQFAALARQRRQLQVREQALSAKERALAERELSNQSATGGIDLGRIKADPLGILQQAGVSYDDLAQAITNNPVQSTVDKEALKQELMSSLKQELTKDFEARDSRAEQEVLTQIGREAKEISDQNEEFELVKATNSVPEVVELVHRTWKKTGEVLSTEEALKLVEEDLLDQLAPIAKTKKIQTRLMPSEVAEPQRTQMRTLTNRDSAPAPVSRRDRAMAAFHGLKK